MKIKKILATLLLSLFIVSGVGNTITSVYAADELDALLNDIGGGDIGGTTTTTTDMSMGGDLGGEDLGTDYGDGTTGGYETTKDTSGIYTTLANILSVLGWDVFYKSSLSVSFFFVTNEELKKDFGTADRLSLIIGRTDKYPKISAKDIFAKLGIINKTAILLSIIFLLVFFYYLIWQMNIVSVEKKAKSHSGGRRDEFGGPSPQDTQTSTINRISFFEFLSKLNQVRTNDELDEETKKVARILFIAGIIMSFITIVAITFSYSNVIDFNRAGLLSLGGFMFVSFIIMFTFMVNMVVFVKMIIGQIAQKYYSSDGENIDYSKEIIMILGKTILINVILIGFAVSYVVGMIVDIILS